MQSLRLIPLALAALASVATSEYQPPNSFGLQQADPVDGAIDVPADVQPRVWISRYVDDEPAPIDPAWLSLRTAAGAPVAGTAILAESTILAFVPAAPLPGGDYVLVVERQPGMELLTEDAVLLEPEKWAESDIGVRFRVAATPSFVGSDFGDRPDEFTLAFDGPIDAWTLESRLHVLDEAGQPIAVGLHWLADSPSINVVNALGAASFTIDAGVRDLYGREVGGLPVTY